MSALGRDRLIRRLRYAFDRAVAAGAVVLIGCLGLMAALFAIAAGLLLSLGHISQTGGKPLGVVEATWESLMRTLDPGTMGGDQGWRFRAVMLTVTLAGLLFVSTLISLVNDGVGQMFDRLRKGRSPVLEREHVVVLGWSSAIFAVVSQLHLARRDKALKGRVVVLADVDPVAMHDEVAAKSPRARPLPIFRRGSPTSPEDLALVSPHRAKAVIVLAPDEPDDDAELIKTMLALHSLRARAAEATPWPHLAVELRRPAHEEVIRTIVGLPRKPRPGAPVESPTLGTSVSDDLMARIIVQSSRQAGLSGVYDDLLSFEGCEFYTEEVPKAYAEFTFGELVLRAPNASPIGWLRGERLMLAPAFDERLQAKDVLVLVRQEQGRLGPPRPAKALEIEAGLLTARADREAPVTILVLGWNPRGPIVLRELPNYVEAGSAVTVAADQAQVDAEVETLCGRRGRMAINCRRGDTSDRAFLKALQPQGFDHIIVLGYTGPGVSRQAADTRTLITLLHLRHLLDECDGGDRRITVVSEMLDIRNRPLAEVTRADDFVVSDHLISLRLAQTAVNPHIHPILKELLSHDGAELYTRRAGDYLQLPPRGRVSVNYATVLAAGLKRGEAVIGVRLCQDKPAAKPGLNPDRSQPLQLGREDMLVVTAQGRSSCVEHGDAAPTLSRAAAR